MARTRGADRGQYVYGDAGQLVDKEGKPVDVLPVRNPLSMDGDTPGAVIEAEPLPVTEPVTRYIANQATWQKNMEAFELAKLIELAYGEFVVSVDPDEYRRLPSDLRRHFRPVRGAG